MEEKDLKETTGKLNQHLMEELAKAATEGDPARVDEIQQGRTAMSVLERALGLPPASVSRGSVR